MRSRLRCAALGLWTAGIEARLLYLQVLEHAELMARADRQQNRTLKPPAKRGEILDRKGRVLAYSVDADTIAAVPSDIDDPADVAAQVCGALDSCDAERRAAMREGLGASEPFAYIARQITPEEARRVKALALPGLTLLKESRRYYPNSELAAHVLGYVGLDNVGLGGIESALRLAIRGTRRQGADPDRRAPACDVQPRRAAADGRRRHRADNRQYLQYIAERELRAGVAENHAAGRHRDDHGSAHRRDPRAGELADVQPEPFGDRRRSRAQPRRPGSLRTGSDVQDRHRVGRARRRPSFPTT